MKKGSIAAILIVVVVIIVAYFTGLIGGLLKPQEQVYFTVNFTTTNGVNGTVQFNSTVSGGLSPFRYIWTFGDGNLSTLANPKHTYAKGTYTVELIVLDNMGVSRSVTKPVTVT